jgi:hypothetical protein
VGLDRQPLRAPGVDFMNLRLGRKVLRTNFIVEFT